MAVKRVNGVKRKFSSRTKLRGIGDELFADAISSHALRHS